MRVRTLSSTRRSACARPAASASTHRASTAIALRKEHRRGISKLIANNYVACPGVPQCSLRLDAGELHHLGPFLGFRGDEVAEVAGRAKERHRAKVGKARLERGIGKPRLDLPVEL